MQNLHLVIRVKLITEVPAIIFFLPITQIIWTMDYNLSVILFIVH
jgi:hypothetical protein